MLATDRGVPPQSAAMFVDVEVERDQGVLSFSADQYATEITENTPVDSVIYTVQASPGVSLLQIRVPTPQGKPGKNGEK